MKNLEQQTLLPQRNEEIIICSGGLSQEILRQLYNGSFEPTMEVE
jgi:hypothetical protein